MIKNRNFNVLDSMIGAFIERHEDILAGTTSLEGAAYLEADESMIKINTGDNKFDVLFSQKEFAGTTLVEFDEIVRTKIVDTIYYLDDKGYIEDYKALDIAFNLTNKESEYVIQSY